jgi:hypothetical protein
MLATRTWVLLCAGQLGLIILFSIFGPSAETWSTAATASQATRAWLTAVRVIGVTAIVGFIATIPPVVLRSFIAGQVRIGNGSLPKVVWLQQHETAVIVGVWILWATGFAMAAPTIMQDIRKERAENAATAAVAAAGLPATVDEADLVMTPGVRTPPYEAVVDGLRAATGATGRFRVGHLRMWAGWAFVQATEVVDVDEPGGEEQETDLSVMALMELSPGRGRAEARVDALWTLPTEGERPLAEFRRQVRARQKALRMPDKLFPDDL